MKCKKSPSKFRIEMCRIMPIVTIKIAKGRSLEIKRKLVESVTEAISTSLEMDSSYVTVLIEELERENWATGGELHVDKYGKGHGHRR